MVRLGQVVEVGAFDTRTSGTVEGFERVNGGVVLHVFVNDTDMPNGGAR